MSHVQYKNFIEHSWESSQGFMNSIQSFTDKIQVWNKEVFGNIFQQKNKLYARIGGVQKILEHRWVPRLVNLETELKTELDMVLQQEESLWHQKSRSEWVNLGDRNTSFFHMRTIRRRKRNRIELLQNEDGKWVDDQSRLKKMAVSFYEALYGESGAAQTIICS